MLKSAVVFFRKLRVSYIVLIAVAIAQQVREFNLILFTLAFIFVGGFFDILTDTMYMSKRVKDPKKEVR
ncbi:hypothetical protein [Peptacetobacter sp.]|uniref:hypothetical protein n=1 Tax=Peptacetobacter sp. TaxID=2991975 RepID=UPI003AB376D7